MTSRVPISRIVQIRSLTKAREPRPHAKKANRQLSCSVSPGRPTPSATKTGPTGRRDQQARDDADQSGRETDRESRPGRLR